MITADAVEKPPATRPLKMGCMRPFDCKDSQQRRALAQSLLLVLTCGTLTMGAAAECRPGVYGETQEAFVVIGGPGSVPGSGQRYLFPDGRRGTTASASSPVSCDADVATVTSPGMGSRQWPRQATRETDTSFVSAATRLAGRLVEPAGEPDIARPLVVLVHGSEKTPAIGSVYAYMLAAQGVSAFVYDKRGTGASFGEYTQNFELLADDAAAALQEARRLAAGRFRRAGFYGGSQGGWVAPLAATRAPADYVAVGFGLVVSPIEEDREQLLDEARQMKLDASEQAKIERLSRATATLLRSNFRRGYEELARVRREIGSASWGATLQGEYSGDMLRMSDADLRRIGRARFDNLELIWDYDAAAVLQKLKVPLLWVLAGEDREAPIDSTRAILLELKGSGKPIDAYVFPDTDHGMVEFRTHADGSRTPTRITDGYLRLLADWIKGELRGSYGRAQLVR